MDKLSSEKRSWNMSRIRHKNTRPEIIVRSVIHNLGYRFRLNRRDLPGCPDIVLPKYSTVIFVDGCYWHRHRGCKKSTTPKTNTEFWEAKFKANKERDRKVRKELKSIGWNIVTVWECKTVDQDELSQYLKKKLGEMKI